MVITVNKQHRLTHLGSETGYLIAAAEGREGFAQLKERYLKEPRQVMFNGAEDGLNRMQSGRVAIHVDAGILLGYLRQI